MANSIIHCINQHACISLNSKNKIRLIRFPQAVIDVVRETINDRWHLGIQRERWYNNAYEFKLNGVPWFEQGDDSVKARCLIMSILSSLYHHGWNLLISTDISKKKHDKDVLIFKFGVPLPPTSFLIAWFNEYDKLHLIGASDELISAIRQAIGVTNIQNEQWVYSRTAYQFKLRGYPWYANAKEILGIQFIILNIIDCLRSNSWEFYGSIDMNVGNDGTSKDTWIFHRSI